jgi:hypothetical protein
MYYELLIITEVNDKCEIVSLTEDYSSNGK